MPSKKKSVREQAAEMDKYKDDDQELLDLLDQLKTVEAPADAFRTQSQSRQRRQDRILETKFLGFVHLKAVPRSGVPGDHIKYGSLVQYREALCFWTKHVVCQRTWVPPPYRLMHLKLTKHMHKLQRLYPSVSHGNSKKTYLGLEELRQLTGYAMYENICIENSEQHQLAWCLS
ncbi:uncharacterized protein J3D65DRAFT_666663 [Phyllosticta citribraziliensis]|uniref:Uncharacterized protein n=1 Tax=Phyllosticta citribraziliensis TaxID=989973 RepID=A0ABR1M107_9PEZI